MEMDYIMEKVNERRRFVKGIGFFAAILGGGSALGAANSSPVVVPTMGNLPVTNDSSNPVSEPIIEDISHLAPPENATTLQINGAYGEKPKPVAIGNGFYFASFNQPTTHSVSMTVGLDNRLWIKIGDTWKRVAVEG